jgi:type IV pilus biogenesis protein PilP
MQNNLKYLVLFSTLLCCGAAGAQSATDKWTADKNGTDKPALEKVSLEKHAAHKHGSEGPGAQKATADQPAASKWAAEKAVADKSVYEKSPNERSAAEKPDAEKEKEKAASERSHAEKSASDRLTQIETETLLLKAREKQIDVQASILTKQNEIVLKQAMNDQLTHKSNGAEPMVRSIEGIGKSMYATLQLSNGNLVEAKVGDVLPNGMKVVSIRPNEVTVQSRSKQQKRLGGAVPTPAQGEFNPNYPGPGLTLPPIPVAIQRGAAR